MGTLINGRDLGNDESGIRPGVLFRSAAPSADDGIALQLRTVIDLRMERERGTHDAAASAGGHAFEAVQGCTLLYKDGLNAGTHVAMKTTIEAQPCCCFKCGLCWSFLTCRPSRADQRLLPVVTKPATMVLMYKAILTDGGSTLCELLELCADSSNHPVLFHCTGGRDRTGVLAMLIQHIAGCSHDYCVRDYAASTEMLLAAKFAERRKPRALPADEPARSQLIDQLARCDPAAMEETLRFVDEKWGGLDQYLDSIGFGAGRRDVMRGVIVAPPAASEGVPAG